MTALSWALLALAAAGLAFGLWQWVSRRRTLRRLNAMLDRAIAGGFAEDRFDETELSALEGKLARFLRGSAAAKKAVEGEQAAVKSLIADISHQTRTPVANLLLYASLLGEGELSPAQREQVQALTAQGEKLSFLIQALVKASRLEAGIVAPVPACNPVGPLLEGAAEQLAQAAQAKGIDRGTSGRPGRLRPPLDGGGPVQRGRQRGEVHPGRRARHDLRPKTGLLLPRGRGGHRPRHPGGGAGGRL